MIDINILRFISVFALLVAGSYFDIFRNRLIPLVLFVVPGIFAVLFFVFNFTIFNFLIVTGGCLISFIYQKYKIWAFGDTLAYIILLMTYPLLAIPTILIGSIATSMFYFAYFMSKGKPIKEIITMKGPFFPGFLVGFICSVFIL